MSSVSSVGTTSKGATSKHNAERIFLTTVAKRDTAFLHSCGFRIDCISYCLALSEKKCNFALGLLADCRQ